MMQPSSILRFRFDRLGPLVAERLISRRKRAAHHLEKIHNKVSPYGYVVHRKTDTLRPQKTDTLRPQWGRRVSLKLWISLVGEADEVFFVAHAAVGAGEVVGEALKQRTRGITFMVIPL